MIEANPSFTALFKAAGLSEPILHIDLCTQGRNNRTFRIKTSKASYILKHYLRQAGDLRDRLATEFAFLRYAKAVAPESVPQAIYQDSEQGMALYEHIEGRPLVAQEISHKEVDQAAEFFAALNQKEVKIKAQSLPLASEACFSIQDHLDLIQARIQLLAQSTVPATVLALLSQAWETLCSQVVKAATNKAFDLKESLALDQRCLSPSDFGFHNALRRPNGTLCFLDFEYAGWDDPAKMSGDFFSQLALPAPSALFDAFLIQTMHVFDDPSRLIHRAALLRPVYRIKWCCIALNIFLPIHENRYRFSNPTLDLNDFKQKQINKVNTLIQTLETTTHGLY